MPPMRLISKRSRAWRLLGARAIASVAGLGLGASALAQPTITVIPALLPTPNDYSFASTLSADGSTVGGSGRVLPGGAMSAIRWTQAGGTQVVPGFLMTSSSSMNALNGIGRYGTGVAAFGGAPGTSAFLFDSMGGTPLRLGTLSGGTDSRGVGISADGTVIAGWGGSVSGNQSFIWTSSLGTLAQLPLAGGITGGALATGISADGLTIVGYGGPGVTAWHWDNLNQMVSMGYAAGTNQTRANAVSADGSVIAGGMNLTPSNREHAFRWTSAGGYQDLGVLTAGLSSGAYGISYDGSVIVGVADAGTPSVQHGFLWTQSLGMVDLHTYLPSLGIDLTGWTLTRAWAVSADGSAIAGDSIYNGGQRGYIVRGLPASTRWFLTGSSWTGATHWALTQNGASGASTPSYGNKTYVVLPGGSTVSFDANQPTAGGAGLASLTIDRASGSGVVTLSQTSPGTSMMVTGTITIGPNGAYLLNAGTLSAGAIVNNGSLTVSGSGRMGAVGSISGNPVTYSGMVTLTGGTHTADLATAAGTTIIKDSGAPLTVSGTQTYAAGTILECQQGTTTFASSIGGANSANLAIHANATKVTFAVPGSPSQRVSHANAVTINTPGQVALDPGAPQVLVTSSLNIDVADGGRLDIGNGTLILKHTDADHGVAKTAQMTGWTRTGSGGGQWTGTGILSSVAAVSSDYAVGILNNDDTSIGGAGAPIYTTFQGVSVTNQAVFATYTRYGDANCDSTVNAADFNLWLQGFQSGGTLAGWVHGDFNYDTVIDFYDLRLLARSWNSVNGNVTGLQNLINASTMTPSQKAIAITISCMGHCAGDYDCTGTLAVADVFAYLNNWFSGNPATDVNGSGLSVQDVFDFLNGWFGGC